MKTCILLTNHFPYSKGEPFLESEISYLCNAFDNVLIFSSSNCSNYRYVPPNCRHFKIGFSSKFRKRFLKFFYGLFFWKIKIEVPNFRLFFPALYDRGEAFYRFVRIKKILSKIEIDYRECVLYSYWLTSSATTSVLLKDYFLKKYNINVPIVSRAHGIDLYSERRASNFIPFQKYNIEKVDKIYACSKNGMDYLKSKYSTNSNKIFCSYLGTNDYGFSHMDSKDFVIVSCSNVIALKRVDLICSSVLKCLSVGLEIVWHHFGSGDMFDKLVNLVPEKYLGKNIILHGAVSNSEIIDFYKKNHVSVFCNFSLFEGLPVSIMEAQSFGIPCIATDVGGTSEIVNNENGWLVDSKSNDVALSNLISSIYATNDTKLTIKGHLSRKTWERFFDSSKNYERWCNELKGTLKHE